MKQEMMTVVKQRLLAPSIFEMTLQGELVIEMLEPGQFVHVRVGQSDLLLRRPISICQINHEKNECVLIYRVEGQGTNHFSQLAPGEKLDVMGPLGKGFPIAEVNAGETILIIGGGIGIPPLYELSRQLVAKGAKVINLHGFRDSEAIFYEKAFKRLGKLGIATEDGSYGTQGYVFDILDTNLSNLKPDAVYACGPNGLLQAVNQRFKEHARAYISLEARMACGMGACYACVCEKAGDQSATVRICKEGPVIKTGEVII